MPALWLLLLLLSPLVQDTSSFDDAFAEGTMRVDYFHTGGPRSGETFALDRVVHDGPWPGSRTQLVDETNLGQYRFRVRRGGRVLYSRGFGSIYGEWETTAEAKTAHRTFHESLRFPWPRHEVTVSVDKRQKDNVFREVWSTTIDPNSRFVNRAPIAPPAGRVVPLAEHGPPRGRLTSSW